MNDQAIFILIAAPVIIIGVIIWMRSLSGEYIELLKKQALKRNGRVKKDLIGNGTLFFDYRGFNISIGMGASRYSKWITTKIKTDLSSLKELSAEIQNRLSKYKEKQESLSVNIERNDLKLTIKEWFKTDEEFDDWINTITALCDKLKNPAQTQNPFL